MGSNFSYTGSQTGFGCQYGCSCHSIASCDEKCIAHTAFVGKVVARSHHVADIAFFQDGTFAVGILYELMRKADIQYLEAPDVLLHVGKHHGKLFLLECQGKVCMDDVGMDVIGVIFAHQSGRDVDTYHLGCTLVDVFHHCSKTSG